MSDDAPLETPHAYEAGDPAIWGRKCRLCGMLPLHPLHADLKAESDLIIARGRIENVRRDAVALRERAMRVSGYVSCPRCHEEHSPELTCNFAGILRDASER